MAGVRGLLFGMAAIGLSAAALAQPVRVQTAAEALTQDAGEYARAHDVSVPEAVARLRAQEDSVAETDRIAAAYADRLAGISIEHRPRYRIVVLLTGSVPVRDRFVSVGGIVVPIVFRNGAAATRDELAAAIMRHQAEIRSTYRQAQGMGVDTRTGELVVFAKGADADRRLAMGDELAAMTGVPVRVRSVDGDDVDFGIEGGCLTCRRR